MLWNISAIPNRVFIRDKLQMFRQFIPSSDKQTKNPFLNSLGLKTSEDKSLSENLILLVLASRSTSPEPSWNREKLNKRETQNGLVIDGSFRQRMEKRSGALQP